MGIWKRAMASFERDQAQGLTTVQLASKSARYLVELAVAPLYLRGVNEVGDGVRTIGRPRIANHGFISIGAGVVLRSENVPVELSASHGARITIGDEAIINFGVSFGATREIRVGRRCRLGPYVMLIDTEFHDLYHRAKSPEPMPVCIEDDVWLGAKVSVLPGVTVGRGAVVGLGSVVTRDVAPFTVVAGVPARPVRRLDARKFVAS